MAPNTVVVHVKQAAVWDYRALKPHSTRLESLLRDGFCCTGILFPRGFILTPAAPAAPFITPFHLTTVELSKRIEVSALVASANSQQNENTESLDGDGKKLLHWISCRLVGVFRNDEFHELMKEYFPLSAESQCASHKQASDVDRDLQDLQLNSGVCLADFLVLQMEHCAVTIAHTPLVQAGSVCKGDHVFVYGCPFGWTLPEVFHSSVSSGIVSNMLGVHSQLLITDARCVDGTEGSAMTVTVNGQEYLAGVVISWISGRSDECTSSLALVCSIDSIRKSLSMSEPELAALLFGGGKVHAAIPQGTKMRQDFGTVVLVMAGCSSGSGVVIDPCMKLVLTCGHVIQQPNTIVRVALPSEGQDITQRYCSANVVWMSTVPDIALLKLNTTAQLQSLCLDDDDPVDLKNAKVCLIGHAKLSHQYTGLTVTHGIISNVVSDRAQPVMLQMSAIVSEGASGGAVILAGNNKLVGIAACNVSDETGKKRHCDISLAIPISWIRPVVQAYRRQVKFRDGKEFELSTETARLLWQLKSSLSCPNLVSKL